MAGGPRRDGAGKMLGEQPSILTTVAGADLYAAHAPSITY